MPDDHVFAPQVIEEDAGKTVQSKELLPPLELPPIKPISPEKQGTSSSPDKKE